MRWKIMTWIMTKSSYKKLPKIYSVKNSFLQKLQTLGVNLKVIDKTLKINAPKGVLTKELVEEIKANKEYLLKLLSPDEVKIPVAEIQESYPVTSSQKRFWILDRLGSGNGAYNITTELEFHGKLNEEIFTKTYIELSKRHESFRTYFQENEAGTIKQHIAHFDKDNFKIDVEDVSESESKKEAAITEHYMCTHELSKAPLIRIKVLKIAEEKFILLFNMHHIIGDGLSMEIMCAEFMHIYNALTKSEALQLPDLPIQYKDYACWLMDQKPQLEQSEAYWLNKLAGELPTLDFPYVHKRPKVKTYAGAVYEYNFSDDFYKTLITYTKEFSASLFMGLMAGINGLFYQYTNTTDIVLGTAIAGRHHADLENQIGLFLNTLAIRTEFDETVNFEELLNIQKETLIQAYKHQKVPFDVIVDGLKLQRDVSKSVLFDFMVILQSRQKSTNDQITELDGISIKKYKKEKKFSQYDCTFSFIEQESSLSISVEYNTDIYNEIFIKSMITHLENFMTNAIQSSEKPIKSIPYLTTEEEKELLFDNNITNQSYDETQTVVSLFRDIANKKSDETAIVFEEKRITYKELNTKSDQLAAYLLNSTTIDLEDRIGIQLQRSEWLIITMIAILKTGAAYVPIDPEYPQERVNYISKDSQCKLIIDENFLLEFQQQETIFELPEIKLEAHNLAYVIYTSGSTGKPKGVMIEHKNGVSFLENIEDQLKCKDYTIIAATTNVVFDISFLEIFGALCTGKTMVVFSEKQLALPDLFIQTMIQNDVQVLQTTPSRFSLLWENILNTSLPSFKLLLIGGEAFPNALFKNRETFNGIEILNVYGPTEATVWSTYLNITETDSLHVGKPLANEQVYVLSEDLLPKPKWVKGELFIGGDGVGRGYLNRDELTKKQFIKNPFLPGNKLYRTGDLAKWLPNGNIDLIGRVDNQIKIRGHRVELGEIEQVISKEEAIEQVVVDVHISETTKVIVAYVVVKHTLDKKALQLRLKQILPHYMLPSYFIEIAEIPLNKSGKIDKKKLPKIQESDLLKEEYIAPTNDTEIQLATIWKETLGLEQIGVLDDFFALGGDSLKFIKIANNIHKIFGVEVDMNEFFLNSNIQKLAKEINFNVQLKNNTTVVPETKFEDII